MADFETEQARLTELHTAFGAKLASDMLKHKEQCAALNSELNVREKVATDRLRLATELDAALKERTIALERKEQAHNEMHEAVRSRFAALISEMDKDAAARAAPARVGS